MGIPAPSAAVRTCSKGLRIWLCFLSKNNSVYWLKARKLSAAVWDVEWAHKMEHKATHNVGTSWLAMESGFSISQLQTLFCRTIHITAQKEDTGYPQCPWNDTCCCIICQKISIRAQNLFTERLSWGHSDWASSRTKQSTKYLQCSNGMWPYIQTACLPNGKLPFFNCLFHAITIWSLIKKHSRKKQMTCTKDQWDLGHTKLSPMPQTRKLKSMIFIVITKFYPNLS